MIDAIYVVGISKKMTFLLQRTRTSFHINAERRRGRWPEMETRLNDWILEKRNLGCCLTGKTLKAQSMIIYAEVYMNITNKHNFQASDGWFSNFLYRFAMLFYFDL